MAQTFRMLKFKGKLVHWNPHVAKLPGVQEVEMTEVEIREFSKPPVSDVGPAKEEVVLKTTVDDKPGPGYTKNSKGTWEAPKKKEEPKQAKVSEKKGKGKKTVSEPEVESNQKEDTGEVTE